MMLIHHETIMCVSVFGERNGIKEEHVAADIEWTSELFAGMFELVLEQNVAFIVHAF